MINIYSIILYTMILQVQFTKIGVMNHDSTEIDVFESISYDSTTIVQFGAINYYIAGIELIIVINHDSTSVYWESRRILSIESPFSIDDYGTLPKCLSHVIWSMI